ncbi:hypothetical protein ACLBWP_01245 [Microbacterium sp. M1A1_1b]|uniref:hypothetical protein n=1 Tax=Curtobacterium sp. VKM Ac-2922 TaxID=2929475 RepID=UPI001FB1E592|nr:hypothetical protein [Curtobacterium sp. VKM Ac-2922]MCJ1714827.1 hypothetical protein [Curtobacterium sp. VKM Ac-2922]
MNTRRPRYTYPWVGAATWAAATVTVTFLAVRTPPGILSLDRQDGEPITIGRNSLAAIAPALVGVCGLIVFIAFAVRTVLNRRFPLVALPAVFRALRADAAVVVLSACALMMIQLVQNMAEDGTLSSKALVVAVRILAVGLAVGGALFTAGVCRGFSQEDLHYAPQFVGAVGITGAGVLGLAVSVTDNLAATVITAAIAALSGAFTSLVLSIRNLARHEREHPPGSVH